MFVKWAITKLLITMHLAMPADIFTKAVDLETHTKMRNLMMNIPWATAFYRRVGLPPEREAAGRNTSSSNTKPVLETAHEDAERDDDHLVGNTAKLTLSRLWREVMNEGGRRSGSSRYVMSKRPAATTIGRTSPRQTRREYRVSAPPGGSGRVGSGGHCVTTPEEVCAPCIRAATHAGKGRRDARR